MLANLLNKPKDYIVFALFIVLILLTSYILIFHEEHSEEVIIHDDLDMILQRDTLVAITDNSSTSYFLYKGKPMGYKYDLLNCFADHLDVSLKIIPINNIEEAFIKLASGKTDIIAIDLTITTPRRDFLNFTIPFKETRQVLVQRKYGWGASEENTQNDTIYIEKLTDLAGKTIHIQKNSAYRLRLRNLAAEIGAKIEIVEVDIDTDELITMVSEGEILYTVADEHIAMANSTWYDNIDISTAISFPQSVAWAVKPGSDSLLAVLNDWIASFTKTRHYNQIFRRYFVNKKAAHLRDLQFHSVKGGKISRYDDLIRKHTEGTAWDWRLIAALIFEESRFNPRAESWAGAYGLTQLMPATAKRFNVKNIHSPEEQIKGGIRFLNYLNENLPEDITDLNERIKFILASYNIGMSHILDAYDLAKKYGEDPTLWKNGIKYLQLKSQPKYFNDPVVRAGYARGRETKRFVTKVMQRYQDYKNVLPD